MSEIDGAAVKASRVARAARMAQEGVKARADYDQAVEQRDQNTARLKALRLEKERIAGVEAAAVAAAKPAKKASKPKAKAKA